MIQEGIYPDLSSEAYHGDRDSISRTVLMEFDKSPYHYWARYLNPDKPDEKINKNFEIGSAFHTLVLEPHLFDEQYFVMPEKVLKRDNEELFNAYKKAEQEAESCQSKVVLSCNDSQRLLAMRDAIYRNPRAKELIEGAIYEQSYFWQDKDSGLIVKARPDIIHRNMYVDLKSCADASPKAFQREMIQYGYHTQGAMVRDARRELEGIDCSNVINIAVEKTYPYAIGIYIIDEFALDQGELKYKQLLVDLKHALVHNTFQSYGIQTISLPKWAIN